MTTLAYPAHPRSGATAAISKGRKLRPFSLLAALAALTIGAAGVTAACGTPLASAQVCVDAVDIRYDDSRCDTLGPVVQPQPGGLWIPPAYHWVYLPSGASVPAVGQYVHGGEIQPRPGSRVYRPSRSSTSKVGDGARSSASRPAVRRSYSVRTPVKTTGRKPTR